jgi:hypothetical protein
VVLLPQALRRLPERVYAAPLPLGRPLLLTGQLRFRLLARLHRDVTGLLL